MSHITRREILKIGIGGGLALTGQHHLCAEDAAPLAKVQSMILIWLDGGAFHAETFDPKPRDKRLLTTCATIDTVVDGMQLCEGLEGLATVMDRGALVRSYRPGESNHSDGVYKWHTGHRLNANSPFVPPPIGAVITRILGQRQAEVPPFVTINDVFGNRVPTGGGFLGPEFNSFHIPHALRALSDVRPRVSAAAFERRRRMLAAWNEQDALDGVLYDRWRRSVESAQVFATSRRCQQIFDLDTEPDASAVHYHRGGGFGAGCLLARRLIEAGSRFVEVAYPRPHDQKAFLAMTDGSPKGQRLGDWDYHGHKTQGSSYANHMHAKRLLDEPLTQLIRDLEERGLLSSTVIVVGTEFSRSGGKVKKDHAPGFALGQGHHGGVASTAFFGGGIRPGGLHGVTSSDEKAPRVLEGQVDIADLHATIYELFGIDPHYAFEVEQRPVRITKDGKGQAIRSILA